MRGVFRSQNIQLLNTNLISYVFTVKYTSPYILGWVGMRFYIYFSLHQDYVRVVGASKACNYTYVLHYIDWE